LITDNSTWPIKTLYHLSQRFSAQQLEEENLEKRLSKWKWAEVIILKRILTEGSNSTILQIVEKVVNDLCQTDTACIKIAILLR